MPIRIYSQKCYIFAKNFEKRYKSTKKNQLYKKNLKIMKHYQILIKGIASNRLKLLETTNYKSYEEMLETYRNAPLIVIITTNIYYDE